MTYLLGLLCLLLTTADSRVLPMLRTMEKIGLVNRDKVRSLQLQTMLRAMEKKREQIYKILDTTHSARLIKGDVESTVGENHAISEVFGEHIPWDITRSQVPFQTLIRRNTLQKKIPIVKREAPCARKKRSIKEVINTNTEPRALTSSTGEGIVPAINMYNELCEDSQPVQIVKIDKLVIENGVIRDQNIIQKAMLK